MVCRTVRISFPLNITSVLSDGLMGGSCDVPSRWAAPWWYNSNGNVHHTEIWHTIIKGGEASDRLAEH